MTRRLTIAAALAGCGLMIPLAIAAGSGDGPAATPARAAAKPQAGPAGTAPSRVADQRRRAKPLPGLPGYTAGFERWLRLNKKPIPPDSADSRTIGFDAHRSVKNVYVNRGRAKLTRPNGRQRLPYPPGTILVKTGRTGSTITLVAIMRKIKGFDPRHGNWQFVEYKRSRADQRFTTSASLRDGTCWGCHATVAKDDWVFTALDR